MRNPGTGGGVEQANLDIIEVKSLLNETIVDDAASASHIFAQEGMKGKLIIEVSAATDADLTFTLQEKQNGAWATKPNEPPINSVTAAGTLTRLFTVSKWTEVRVLVTATDTGDPGGDITADVRITLLY